METRCPFYGFHWPPATPELIQVGGGECGLALDVREPCMMEVADYERCSTAQRWKPILECLQREIRFQVGAAKASPLEDVWHSRAGDPLRSPTLRTTSELPVEL